jgi:hypothetical protein
MSYANPYAGAAALQNQKKKKPVVSPYGATGAMTQQASAQPASPYGASASAGKSLR